MGILDILTYQNDPKQPLSLIQYFETIMGLSKLALGYQLGDYHVVLMDQSYPLPNSPHPSAQNRGKYNVYYILCSLEYSEKGDKMISPDIIL